MNAHKYFKIGAISIMLLGALVRVVIFFQNHSIFLDEANLARNIIEKPFLHLFLPLDYQQYAPPLFLVVEKVNVFLFGVTEYALRLFPLLASLISIGLFYKLLRRYLPNGFPLLLNLFIFSFGEYYLHYAVEGKQYAPDILFMLWVFLYALNEKGDFNARKALKWTLIGVIYIWFSMPAVFILSGIGLFLGIKIIETKVYKRLWWLSISIMTWLFSFGVYYFKILRKDIQVEGLQNFHEEYFLPLFPTSIGDLQQISTILKSILDTGMGHTGVATLVGIVGVALGIWFLVRKDKKAAILFLVPIIVTLIASALHVYSLIPRLTLFFMPILLLVVALGLQFLFEKMKLWQKGILTALLLITAGVHTGISFLWQPFEIEDTRGAIYYIENNKQPNDYIYVSHEALPAFYFYKNLYQYKENYSFNHVIKGDWHFKPEMSSFTETNRVWFLHSHLLSIPSTKLKSREMEIMKPYFIKKEEKIVTGASAILLERK